MIIHQRKIGKELLYWRALSRRMELDKESRKTLEIHERGYRGELTYDNVYDEHLNHLYVFRGIYLKVGNSVLQCDALIVSDHGLIVHEIKNYSGNYNYENEKWFVRNFQISEDPLSQLKRTTNKLLKIGYNQNLNFTIEGKVVFPNIDFALTSTDENVWNNTIMRNQLKRYLIGFRDYPVTHNAAHLAEIIQSHIIDDPFFNVVADFDLLRKGVYCRACGSFDVRKSRIHFKCNKCNHRDTIHTVTLLAIADLSCLFKNEDITRNQIFTLLNGQVGLTTISKVLQIYCITLKKGACASYQFKYYDFDEAYHSESRLWRYKDSQIKLLN